MPQLGFQPDIASQNEPLGFNTRRTPSSQSICGFAASMCETPVPLVLPVTLKQGVATLQHGLKPIWRIR
jgi:hypothetical protein